MSICFLVPIGGIMFLPRVKEFDCSNFFRTENGIRFWPTFKNRVLSAAATISSPKDTPLQYFSLTKNAYDFEIKNELPDGHQCELWQIATLMQHQWNGEEGPLLTQEPFGNLFFVQNSVLHVTRRNGVWGVGDWMLGERGLWPAGDRVFSQGRNTFIGVA